MLNIKSGFGPDYESVEIKQNIGGYLIANSVYNADFHSWNYDISYLYKTSDNKIYNIGEGNIEGPREWKKDEQLIEYKDWFILKTSYYNNDKIIVRSWNLNSDKKIDYIFSPDEIEKEPIWMSKNINSSPDYYDSFTRINSINSEGEITVLYNYAIKDRILSSMTSKKLLKYQINFITGIPELKEVID